MDGRVGSAPDVMSTRKLDARTLQSTNGLACMSICRSDDSTGGDSARIAIGGEKVLAIVEAKRKPGEDLPTLKLARRFGSSKKAQNVIRISDVKWHPKKPTLIATGSSTGMIFLWDVTTGAPTPLKHSSHAAVADDHPQGPGWGVKRVCWHTKQESLLLSACTDSTVKLWDTRTYKEKAPCTFRQGPEGQNLWIKDVEVDPFDENSFVCCNEAAELLYWDLRMPDRKPKRRIPASMESSGKGAINSLNWHPTRPGVLATGSKDYSMRVWDLLEPPPDAHREIAPQVTISTIASVGRVHWRPTQAGHSHQIAEVSLSPLDVDLNIWDQCSALLPLCCVRKPHGVVITDLEWWDPNGELIFSTAKSGSFAVSSVKQAYVHAAEMCTSSVAWGPGGRLAFHNDAVHFPQAGRAHGSDPAPVVDSALSFVRSRCSSPASQAASSPPYVARHSCSTLAASPAQDTAGRKRSYSTASRQSKGEGGFLRRLFGGGSTKLEKKGSEGPKVAASAESRVPEKPPPPQQQAVPAQTFPQAPAVPAGAINGLMYHVATGVENEARFYRLASEYALSGMPPHALCEHNARVCRAVAPHDTVLQELWDLVATFCHVASLIPNPHPPCAPACRSPSPRPQPLDPPSSATSPATFLPAGRESFRASISSQRHPTHSPAPPPAAGHAVPACAAALAVLACGTMTPPASGGDASPPPSPPREREKPAKGKAPKRRARRTSQQLPQSSPRSTTSSDCNLADHESAGAAPRAAAGEEEDLPQRFTPMDTAEAARLSPAIRLSESDGSDTDDEVPLAGHLVEALQANPSMPDSEDDFLVYGTGMPCIEALDEGDTAGGPFRLQLPAHLLSVVEQLLEVGDVQTVATMVCCVSGAHGVFDFSGYAARGAEWFMSYYDLLCASGLTLVAAKLLKHCPFSKVYSISQSGTSVVAKCKGCRNPPSTKPTGIDSHQLRKSCCYNARLCCVCQTPVRGMYIWSSQCSHGGHFACMRRWYKTEGNRACPQPDCGREVAS